MGLGFTFFVLQGAALVVFMTDNLIISRVLGPEEVPAYNIAFRYFNLASVFFGLVTIPFWSAFTDAYARQDMDWIRKMLRRLMALWAVVSVIGVGMFFAAPLVYAIWIGDVIEVPQVLNLAMMLWVVASTGMSIFGTFLSGVGKLRLSLYQAVVVMVINIPLSIYLAGFVSLGSAGVILASLFGVLIRLFFQPLQCWKILKGTATGIWGK
jgi:O-antigen/teichoic acid export membrane protein